ncbi:MAG: hypothetical protein MUC95_05090 [Spirochaetes bacterium]|nr:hypothetical protein [Spirochaetota bacterium]
MGNEKKKLNATGIIGCVFSILAFFCIVISSMSYIGIKIFCLQIESSLILLFLIIAVTFAAMGVILGFDGRRRWSRGHTADGNATGTSATIGGFVTIGCAAILILVLRIQGATGLIFKEEPKQPDTASTEVQSKEKTAKTTYLVNVIFPHVKNYAKFMKEDSAAPTIEKLSMKYGFDWKDAWGNDIIVKFSKKLDEGGYFTAWAAEVSSAGPDGKSGTEDDINAEKK